MDFVDLLNLDDIDDLELGPGGIRALHRTDIAPLAYELIIIASVYESVDEERVPEFLDGANQNVFERLYQHCNGLHIGATKFGIFGFITGDQSFGVPWDIEIPNHLTPNERPKGTLIVGTSTEAESAGERVKCYHTIQSNYEIFVTPRDDFSTVLRGYSSVEVWIKSEVERALNDRVNW